MQFSKKQKIILTGGSIGLLTVIVILVIFLNSPLFEAFILHTASDSSGRQIKTTEKLDIDWGWPVTSIHVQNLNIGNFEKGSDPTMLSVERLDASFDWRPLFKGDLVFPEIVMDKPNLLLEKDKDGHANWEWTENAGGSASVEAIKPDGRDEFPAISRLVIRDGKFRYKDGVTKTDMNLIIDTVKGEADRDETLSLKGDGSWQGHDFKIDLKGGNIFQLTETDKPYPVDMTMSAGNTRATLKGTMLDPVKLKGMDIALTLTGKDAAELFDLIGMALPPTPPYDVTGKLSYETDIWNFKAFKGRMGDSDLRGSVTWDTRGDRPILKGDFVSNNLDFDDLGGFIGATPKVETGETASAEQQRLATKQEASPFLIPDTPLDISRLAAMDADVTFTGKKLISSSLPLDDFSMKVNLDNRQLKLNPIRFGTANGDIKAYLTVNARQEPVRIDGDFRFRRLMLKPIFEKLAEKFGTKNVSEGYIGGTAQLKGTGKSLRQMLATSDGTIGLGMEGGQISNLVIELLGLDVAQSLGLYLKGDEPVPIRCMLGDFNVNRGVMDVRHFVLDTTDTNITGDGRINLKDETLDMKLYSRPKDTSILSLNSPIGLRGTLKKPDIDLDLKNVAARGGVAAAVGALFPPAAALAFIEPGLGKDSNCALLMRDMQKHTGKKGDASLIPKNKMPLAEKK
ncbi:MAG TPA: AsmA family protein [Alphaproteobacteria bacterium]